MSVISRGDAVQEHLQAGELSIAVAVCYEIAYGHQVGIDSQSANLLMTVSSDTWFGNSIGPHQHFQLAQVRALETSKPVIRGTNNGITGLIDHRGRIQARAEQFSATVLTGSLVPQRGMTPFSRWGQNPMAFLSFLILALVYAAGRYGIFKS
jgi:apolipoprotein N-acyltransferase